MTKKTKTKVNATLIASAPDLLAKLESAVAIIDMMMDAIGGTPPEACQQEFIAMVETIKQARHWPATNKNKQIKRK